MARQLQFRGDAKNVVAVLNQLPAMLSGMAQDHTGLIDGFKLRIGVALLSQIQQDYVRKSRGAVGKDGEKWEKLKPETIARRRTTRDERKRLGIRNRGRGKKKVLRRSLTLAQDAEWQRLFVYHFRIGLRDLPRNAAKRRAAAIAWARIKEQGAKTLLMLLGSREVDILRETGARLRSFEPGIGDTPSGAPGQIFDITQPGMIIVGSTEKTIHQYGDPDRNLPARRAWPADNRIPPAWWPPINKAGSTGLKILVTKFLGG